MVARSPGVDREGVDAMPHQRVERIIDEAVPGYAWKAFEPDADDPDAEVAAFARPGVPGVQMDVVLHREAFGMQGRVEGGFDVGRADCHFSFACRAAGPSAVAGGSEGSGKGFKWRLK